MSYGTAVESYFPQALSALLGQLNQSPPKDAEQAIQYLTALDLDDKHYAPWFDFDHPPQDSYGRLLVARGSNYEIMIMSWAPGDYSAIHDHGAAEWGAVRYFGPADHRIFAVQDQALVQTEQMTMAQGDVLGVDNALIHLMGNPTETPFISLHLYGRNEEAEQITGNARIFDLFEQQIQLTDGGVFFCLPESQIHGREPCPRASKQTTLFHHHLMLARLQRMPAWREQPTLVQKSQALQAAIAQLNEGSARATDLEAGT